MKNEKGFVLIQVMIAATVFSVLALAMMNLISEQRDATAYLEDQLEKIQLMRVFETILKDGIACQNTLGPIQLPRTRAVDIASLKDNSGADVFQSNQPYNHLLIGQVRVTNDTVPGPSSSGFVDIEMPISRIRTGGGPAHLKSLQFKLGVTVDATRRITSCSAAGSGTIDYGTCTTVYYSEGFSGATNCGGRFPVGRGTCPPNHVITETNTGLRFRGMCVSASIRCCKLN